MRSTVIRFSDLGSNWSTTYHLQRGHAAFYLDRFKPEERQGPKWQAFLVRYYIRWLKDAKFDMMEWKWRKIVKALSSGGALPAFAGISPLMWELLKHAWLQHELSRLKVQQNKIQRKLKCLRAL